MVEELGEESVSDNESSSSITRIIEDYDSSSESSDMVHTMSQESSLDLDTIDGLYMLILQGLIDKDLSKLL